MVGGVAPAAHYNYNPPTTACGATSVFETPSVLRESLPSYSAKPGAFYAPRALRWTTPHRGRTDRCQGPKIKPMFLRFSMLFQDDFGIENGGQNGGNICVKSCQEPSETLLEPGCRAMRFSEALGSVLGTPGTSKIVLPHNAGLISANLADSAGSSKIDPNLIQNRGQMASGGVQVASKVVSKKGAISVLIFGPDFHEIPGPRGEGLRGSSGT